MPFFPQSEFPAALIQLQQKAWIRIRTDRIFFYLFCFTSTSNKPPLFHIYYPQRSHHKHTFLLLYTELWSCFLTQTTKIEFYASSKNRFFCYSSQKHFPELDDTTAHLSPSPPQSTTRKAKYGSNMDDHLQKHRIWPLSAVFTLQLIFFFFLWYRLKCKTKNTWKQNANATRTRGCYRWALTRVV